MDAKTKINGNCYTKKEMTGLMLSLFTSCVRINNYAFRGEPINDVIASLLDYVDIDDSCIDKQALKYAITSYCDDHDTGIYY